MILLQTAVAVLLLIAASRAHDDPLVVDTTNGKLRGRVMTSRAGRKFLGFTGVPYAKPPVGSRRFEPPEEMERWTGIRNATEPGPWCIQANTFDITPVAIGTEDCLFLAVYTHRTTSRNAVMIHFHGGGFNSGDAEHKTLPTYMMDKDVVIVDVKYRLSFFGFLSFEDNVMPGNQALKDQVMAMKWVQKNIAKFGGDPNRVTIVGESAGAGSVYHHIVSPMSKGLFHRAIAESGTSYNGWAVAPPGLAKANCQRLAKLMNCPGETTTAAVSCLKTKNATEIANALTEFLVWQIDSTIIWPVFEPEGPGAFLTGPVSKWKHNPVPLMLGTTSGEGLLRTGYFAYYNTEMKWLNDNFARLAPLSLFYGNSSSNPSEVTKKVREFYFNDGQITSGLDSWYNLTQVYTDSWFVIGIIDGANYHSGDVYFYYFDYIGEYTYGPEYNRTLYFGAPHTEEINFIWENPNVNWTLRGDDLKFSRRLVKIWTDFAKFGTPTPRGSEISWSKWNPKRHNYLEMSKSGFNEKEGFAKDRYKFWKSINYRDLLK
nr:esterase 1 [Arma chinensis]